MKLFHCLLGGENTKQRQALDLATILEEQKNYTVYELTFRRDGLKIYGNLYLPTADD